MSTATIIAITAIAAILFFAARYIYKEKKKGAACIGCPYAGSCPKHAHKDYSSKTVDKMPGLH